MQVRILRTQPNGLIEELGCPRFPVTEQTTGSNPVGTANGGCGVKAALEAVNLLVWVRIPSVTPTRAWYIGCALVFQTSEPSSSLGVRSTEVLG